MKKHVLKLILILCFPFLSISQTGTLTLHGKIESEKAILKDINIELVSHNKDSIWTLISEDGKFSIDLPLGDIYNVRFFKEGFTPKSIGVIASSINETDISGRYFFQADFELYGTNDSRIDYAMVPPVAKLYVENPKKGFVYDKNYVKWVKGEYSDLSK